MAATPKAMRLSLLAAALVLAGTSAHAQPRAHLSNDLQQHLDAGDRTATTVVVSGAAADVDGFAARHGLEVRRRLTSGAVLDVPAGRLQEVASDTALGPLSGDQVIHGDMAI